jgi:hypothetical protein
VEGFWEYDNEPSGSIILMGSSYVAAQLAASQEGLSAMMMIMIMMMIMMIELV